MSVINAKRVYVPNKGPHNYSAAEQFGILIFCTEGQINRKDLNGMLESVKVALEDAIEDDYILLTGLTSLCIVACSLFAARFGRINLLMYEGGEYLEQTLVFEE